MVKTSIAGTRIVGRLCAGLFFISLFCRYTLTSYKSRTSFNPFLFIIVMLFSFSFFVNFLFLFNLFMAGNKKGLLLPHTTTDQGNPDF